MSISSKGLSGSLLPYFPLNRAAQIDTPGDGTDTSETGIGKSSCAGIFAALKCGQMREALIYKTIGGKAI